MDNFRRSEEEDVFKYNFYLPQDSIVSGYNAFLPFKARNADAVLFVLEKDIWI